MDVVMKKVFLPVVALLSLTACSIDSPSWVNQERVEVHQDVYTETFDTDLLDDAMLHALAVNHYRSGMGPMKVAVSYDPKSKTNTAAKAKDNAARIEAALRTNGVKDVRVTTTPAPMGSKSTTLISFDSVVAKPPEKCGLMPGYANTPTELPDSGNKPMGYSMGCTVETLMAKQVSRPADLIGRPGFETRADGRRQAVVTRDRGYYGNKPNAPLANTESASGKGD